jgi:diacylglycerol O-acyltransferase / wax synthase
MDSRGIHIGKCVASKETHIRSNWRNLLASHRGILERFQVPPRAVETQSPSQLRVTRITATYESNGVSRDWLPLRRDVQHPARDTNMKKPVPRSCLSPADAAFLYLERKEIPLHIASVSVFESFIPFKEFVASIRSKLHLVPRYRQLVVTPPWNIGLPTWEDDPNFDIHRHIFQVTLDPPGGDSELEALAGRIFSSLLDRNKPLWEMHVVDGLKDGRGAVIWRVHHALADGISGTEMMKVMLDATPVGSYADRKPRYHAPRRRAADGPKDAISSTILSSLENLIAFEKGLLGYAQAILSDGAQKDLKGLRDLLPELAASVERLPFNKPCGGERKFCWTEFNLADVQAVREAVGGTVNDVVLAVLTRALARYVKLHGQTVVNRFVRIVCPVNLRQGNQDEGMGNRISFLPVALPMDVRNPVRLLQAVTTRTETMKRGGAADLVGLAANWIAAGPPPLQALLWRGISEIILPVPLFNMICTNIHGSAVPLYAVGRRMIACYPQVPTGYDLGVNCAVHSYDGKLFFGLIADAQAAPDVGRLRDFLLVSFEELRKSARSKKAQLQSAAARKTAGKSAEVAKPTPTVTPQAAKDMPPATPPAAVDSPVKDAA